MVPHFLRTLLQRGARLSAWTGAADVEVEPLHQIAEVCDGHADLIKGERPSGPKVRDLRGSPS
jgi:hypothetical protein